jgi:ribosomal protein S18 acetylase RimI-like enzyme
MRDQLSRARQPSAGGEYSLRPAVPADQGALAALEAASPEEGDVTLLVRAKVPYFQLVGRSGERQGFVAVDRAGRIEGSTFLLVENLQYNGRIVRAGYISSVRTGRDARRKGLAARLVAHAEVEARAAGCELTWAGVIGGNDASLKFFTRRMGYQLVDRLVGRTLWTWRERLPGRRLDVPDLVIRRAQSAEAESVVRALNRFYADWQFWVPHQPERYASALADLDRDGIGALWLAESISGRLRAAALFADRSRLADTYLTRLAAWPEWRNRLARATLWRRPLRLASAGDLLAVDDDAAALGALLQRVTARLWPRVDAVAVMGDQRSTLGTAIDRLGGPTGRTHLLWKGPEPPDPARPLILR